jgi:hypothetical protein
MRPVKGISTHALGLKLALDLLGEFAAAVDGKCRPTVIEPTVANDVWINARRSLFMLPLSWRLMRQAE